MAYTLCEVGMKEEKVRGGGIAPRAQPKKKGVKLESHELLRRCYDILHKNLTCICSGHLVRTGEVSWQERVIFMEM